MCSIADLLVPGQVVTYVSYMGGKAFGYHWTLYEGPVDAESGSDSQLYRLIFLTEVDAAVIGLGGPPTRIRAELVCKATLFPRFYHVTTNYSVNSLTVDDKIRIKLPRGREHIVEPQAFRCIVGENLGQLSLFLKLAADEVRDGLKVSFFSVGAVSVFEYKLSEVRKSDGRAGEGRRFRSSFLEELFIDQDGWLVERRVPKEGVVAVREDAALPSWMNEKLIEPPLKYTPPDNAGFILQEINVPGPVVPIGIAVTVPKSPGRHPVALFVGGSGSHNRHGISCQVDLGSHEIVDFLSENGWLCGRFDTRGAGTTELGDDFLNMGFEEIVADARAVLNYLLSRPDADHGCAAIIGHSQGGVAALELAILEPNIKCIILLAASGRLIDQVLRDQIIVRGRWLNQTEEQVQEQIRELEEFVELVRRNEEWTPEKIPARFYVAGRLREWYRDHLGRDPCELISRVRCPVLICHGGKDFQVSVDKDARTLYKAGQQAGVEVELAVFDSLDHLFKPVEGCSHVSQYYDNQRRVSQEVKQRVRDFLKMVKGRCAAER